MAFIVGACTEDIESGAACPTLCPGQQLDIIDTVITPAVVLDTTIGDFPLLGLDNVLLTTHLAARTYTAIENMSWVVRDVVDVIAGKRAKYPAP